MTSLKAEIDNLKEIVQELKTSLRRIESWLFAGMGSIIMLLVTAAKIIEIVTSIAERGAYKISIIFPCILDIIKELVECEKLCSIIDWIIKPGARKTIKEWPKTSPLSFPRARLSTDKNNRLDTKGDKSVCAQTTKNLLHSLIHNATNPT